MQRLLLKHVRGVDWRIQSKYGATRITQIRPIARACVLYYALVSWIGAACFEWTCSIPAYATCIEAEPGL